MRILVCNWKDLAHPRAGGAEVWNDGVTRAWVEAGHEVTLAASAFAGRPAREWRHGVEIVRGGDYRVGVHRHARRLYESRDGRFDLVVDGINTRPFGAPRWARDSEVVAFIHQVAREVWFHETPLPVALLGRYVLEPRWLRAYATTPMFTVSASTAASVREYGVPDARVIPMGGDLAPRAVAVEKDAIPTFVFVGRLCSMKQPRDAIQAFRLVQRRVPAARLWVIGTGPDERRLRRLAGDGVEVLGRVSATERDDRIARARALLATSVREGWGMVVSEAAALGTTTIAYAVPGLVDSVAATGGVTVPARPEALAEVMTRYALQPLAALPEPTGTGTVPWSEVAAQLLDEGVSHRVARVA